jgi:hypothetical protein
MPKRKTDPNICPECDHEFQGNGWDGIDAHWRAKHGHIMSYGEAWPLIQSGNYHRKPAKRKPKEDTNQIAYRVTQEIIKKSDPDSAHK